MSSCPDCGSNFVRRIPRTPAMRLLPASERILCSHCGERSLVLPWLNKSLVEKRIIRPLAKRRLGA